MTKRRCIVVLLSGLVAMTVLAATPALAQQKDTKKETTSQSDINKTQAADRARQQVKGRVLKVERQKDQYRVKVLQKSGRVVSVDVDKSSGQVKTPTTKKKEQ